MASLADLLPVIVGGLIGVVGGLAGPPLTHWLNSASEKQRKRHEKFEELMNAIYELDEWLTVFSNTKTFGESHSLGPSPIVKAQVITAINFPQLSKHIDELDYSAAVYK